MSLDFIVETPKELIFEHVAEYLHHRNLRITKQDNTRPWGGFMVINEADAEKFISLFFSQLAAEQIQLEGKLSPKILIVAPEKRLSWQYHNRRAELWKMIGGKAGAIISQSDEEDETVFMTLGDILQIKQGERHRLVGLDGWGIIAEIWQHTEAANPSNEEDIVRLQDDFGR